MIPSLQNLSINDPVKATDINRLSADAKKSIDAMRACPLLDGALVKNVSLSTTTALVSHGLGRAPVGWLVVRARGAGVAATPGYVDFQDSNTMPEKTLNIAASTPIVVDLWIF